MNKLIKNKHLLFLLFAGVLFSVGWVLSKDNGFIFDDYSNIFMAKNQTYAEIFSFFPSQRYNDRCIAVMFVKLLYDIFGLNIQAYHFIYVGIHLMNTYIVYIIIRDFILNESQIKSACAVIGSAVFGIYPVSLMAVSWVSAEYEMVCCLFYLLSILFYLKYRNEKQYNSFYGFAAILCFYLALRSKEMAIVLPILAVNYELKSSFEYKKLKITNVTKAALLIMVVFLSVLFGKTDVSDLTPDEPYYQDYSLFAMMTSAVKYLILYFDLGNSSFTYSGLGIYGFIGILFVVFIAVYSIVIFISKRNVNLLCVLVMLGISIAPVLQLVNMQHRLYLYIPSIFIGIVFALLAEGMLKSRKSGISTAVTMIVIITLAFMNYAPGIVELKSVWYTYCDEDKLGIRGILAQEELPVQCQVYIKGADEGYNVFSYGPGNSIRLFMDNSTINVELVNKFPEDVEAPYVFWEYKQGKVREVKRDATPPKIAVTGVYPAEIAIDRKKEMTDISVTCEELDKNMIIYINGEMVDTIIGADFISASIPNEYLEECQELEIKIINSFNNGESDAYRIPILK